MSDYPPDMGPFTVRIVCPPGKRVAFFAELCAALADMRAMRLVSCDPETGTLVLDDTVRYARAVPAAEVAAAAVTHWRDAESDRRRSWLGWPEPPPRR